MLETVEQVAGPVAGVALLRDRVHARIAAADTFFATNARGIATCAAAMADRFFAGGTLLVFGSGPHATDAQHNAVEFVHPALAGCRALPSLSLTTDLATVSGLLQGADPGSVFAHQLQVLARDRDIALAFATTPVSPAVRRALDAGRERGLLTVTLTCGSAAADVAADHSFHVDSDDLALAHELHLATYHMLWELVHIVLNHRGIAEAGA